MSNSSFSLLLVVGVNCLTVQCFRWWDEDIREANKQDSFYLWLGPYIVHHHLSSLSHLVTLYKNVSSPRDLKCYIKLGLSLAQQHCLPLRVTQFQLEMAGANILCEDEVGASVQVAGAQFVLADILGNKSTKSKVTNFKT